ncbi:hypothetical protein C8Q74DRAFT_277871 [Fomes fomentarius]|nr:hypothetical protein C8Q74DRAFT_277871 [Fomes fomentarius]
MAGARTTTTSMLIIASRPVVYKPTWWHPTFASRTAQAPATPSKPYQKDAGREVDESTPFRYSHLSGMGDSDCAEGARRIARLSLPRCAPVLNDLDLDLDRMNPGQRCVIPYA